MKIATWNLDRPWKNGRRRRADLQREHIRSIGAEIWVLTETWSEIKLPGHHGVATPSSLGTYDASESAVSIWVPEIWGVRTLEVTTATLSAEVLPPDAESPLLVYGTIITWHGDPGGKNWVKHLEEVDRQTTDWVRLRRDYPSHRLIVAGDFNMTLHSDKGYGHQDGRRMVRERLPLAGLECVTAIDIRDAAHGALERDNIDHICIDQRMSVVAGPCTFSGITMDARRMSSQRHGRRSEHEGDTVMTMKLGTWNLMSPVAERRRQIMRLYTDGEQADVWVLTETHDGFTPGHPHSHSSAAGRDGRHKPEHRWVTIWSRHPMESLATSDKERTAAARVTPKSGLPFLVYGTVLPWLGSAWREHPSAGGVAFREAVKVQAADWMRLRHEYPEDELFVLGDFNQDLVRPRYYGTAANRAALETALESAGLVALTAGDGDPIRRSSAPCACIDHICARRDSTWRVEAATRWPNAEVPDRKLTDHFGVAISFKRL